MSSVKTLCRSTLKQDFPSVVTRIQSGERTTLKLLIFSTRNMKLRWFLLSSIALATLAVLVQSDEETKTEVDLVEFEEDSGTARILTSFIFPFFPQYQDIDIGENLNNLKSPNTVAFFLTRDFMLVSV